ncbi:hypothetical protein KDA_51000 [Dictyobacter alpinus]|uniref:Uncharacterized protein n=1 Tax=Dictyobacter alpinus TaxID=2014873 RepID=A0A402BE83_9CHLR|nr:hypothetical protein KDA_51000 [Dictyobacter alpinus]
MRPKGNGRFLTPLIAQARKWNHRNTLLAVADLAVHRARSYRSVAASQTTYEGSAARGDKIGGIHMGTIGRFLYEQGNAHRRREMFIGGDAELAHEQAPDGPSTA